MQTKTIDVSEIKISLQELLSFLDETTEIILTANKIPLAKIVPISKSLEAEPITKNNLTLQPGLHPGAMVMSDDFDKPLLNIKI
ncbi:MAG: toxin-antitoxin (TA) system antitoxin [Oscillatoria sp. PMC 1068.18]|nr:toxin-antitoxin (TA) system antitoxin [Oscillatoria sp. PMC 1076.18]MEC4987161.1 toxin-antitoxin (TA) system antitoxin [Oscillatoria sp. PMC 1068.18]